MIDKPLYTTKCLYLYFKYNIQMMSQIDELIYQFVKRVEIQNSRIIFTYPIRVKKLSAKNEYKCTNVFLVNGRLV